MKQASHVSFLKEKAIELIQSNLTVIEKAGSDYPNGFISVKLEIW